MIWYDAFLMILLLGIKYVIKFCMYNGNVICIKATKRLNCVFVLLLNSMHIKFRSNLSSKWQCKWIKKFSGFFFHFIRCMGSCSFSGVVNIYMCIYMHVCVCIYIYVHCNYPVLFLKPTHNHPVLAQSPSNSRSLFREFICSSLEENVQPVLKAVECWIDWIWAFWSRFIEQLQKSWSAIGFRSHQKLFMIWEGAGEKKSLTNCYSQNVQIWAYVIWKLQFISKRLSGWKF